MKPRRIVYPGWRDPIYVEIGPPLVSANRMHRHTVRGLHAVRYPSPAWKAFRDRVVASRIPGWPPVPIIHYELLLEVPCDRRLDPDNLIKPVSDALAAAEIILDDRWCESVRAVREPGVGDGIVATVIPLPPQVDTCSKCGPRRVLSHGRPELYRGGGTGR